MPITFFAIKVALASLLIGFLTGWHGLFHISVWSVAALVPAVVIDAILALLGERRARCTAR